MSLSLNGAQNLFGGIVDGTARNGPELETIQTDALGFLPLSGEAMVQLLPRPWPADHLPPPTASLLSIASQRGLIVAAGPNAVIVATTKSVREAFKKPKSDDNSIRSFEPELTLPMPMRVSQVAFTADENCLVLSAEVGGGLAIYDVQALLNGSTQTTFEMSTNSMSLRALVPNPTPEKGELLALVTTDGKLMIANLKEKKLISRDNDQILKANVSCVSWSARGKQVVAGLGDGTAYQMAPEGDGKFNIPRPPNVGLGYHVSSISWLENNVFLIVHTPTTPDTSQASTSKFHIVTRQPSSEYVFQKFEDPTPPFGLDRLPPHHFIIRLREFPPHLQDLLIMASSASTDIGLLSRSTAALDSDKEADKITGVFTLTEMLEDSRRAQVPMTDMTDTSPIGMALDLSSTDKVVRPIVGVEIEESSAPIPALMLLNNDGILASWWVIYTESIRKGSAYPGLVVQSNLPPSGSAANSNLDRQSFGTPSGPIPTFGAPSGLQKTVSPWIAQTTSPSASGGGTFGSTAPPVNRGVAFGSSTFPGQRNSVWATGSTKPPGMTFGQPATVSRTGGGMTVPSSGGFASFANQGGFASIASTQANAGGAFGSKQQVGWSMTSDKSTVASQFGTGSGFAQAEGSAIGSTGSTVGTGLPFGTAGPKNNDKSIFSLGPGGFSLGSTFKPDKSATGDDIRLSDGGGISMFGKNFENVLGEAQRVVESPITESADADMDADEPTELRYSGGGGPNIPKEQSSTSTERTKESTTPMSTPAGMKFQFPNPVPPVKGDLFKTPVKVLSTDVSSQKPVAANSRTLYTSIEGHSDVSNTINNSTSILQLPSTPKVSQIEQEKSENSLAGIPEPPLPPDPVSKTSYIAGESSVSSTEPDVPLPPDFISTIPSHQSEEKKSKDFTRIHYPQDEISGKLEEVSEERVNSKNRDEEKDGDDITKDISPVSNSLQTPILTPQSSTGGVHRVMESSSISTIISQPTRDQKPRTLFCEVDGTTISRLPALMAPKQASPRSPSPIRTSIPSTLRSEPSRSVSAPSFASQLLSSRAAIKSPQVVENAFSIPSEQNGHKTQRQEEFEARNKIEELIDEDYETQKVDQEDIVGSKILADFVAHQDYVGNAGKDSIPAQVEILCRDIRSMIDTLGINSYTLKSFIKGHTEQFKDLGRTKEDLEGDDEWCLGEISCLDRIIEDLKEELCQGQVTGVDDKLQACANLERDLVKLRSKHDDIKVYLTSRSDPDRLAVVHSLPLTAEQATQQHDLRRDLSKFRRLLTEAEEELVLLRAKLAPFNGINGKTTAGPTVEAVVRTINKMTIMVEKRSGDIDVLENQMRKLRFGSTTGNASREGSPFTTPTRFPMRSSGGSSAHGLFYTPDTVRDTPHGTHSFISSTFSARHGTPTRKKISSFSDNDKQRFKASAMHRMQITNKVTTALQKCGTRILPMDSQ